MSKKENKVSVKINSRSYATKFNIWQLLLLTKPQWQRENDMSNANQCSLIHKLSKRPNFLTSSFQTELQKDDVSDDVNDQNRALNRFKPTKSAINDALARNEIEIIDGQQRTATITQYCRDALKHFLNGTRGKQYKADINDIIHNHHIGLNIVSFHRDAQKYNNTHDSKRHSLEYFMNDAMNTFKAWRDSPDNIFSASDKKQLNKYITDARHDYLNGNYHDKRFNNDVLDLPKIIVPVTINIEPKSDWTVRFGDINSKQKRLSTYMQLDASWANILISIPMHINKSSKYNSRHYGKELIIDAKHQSNEKKANSTVKTHFKDGDRELSENLISMGALVHALGYFINCRLDKVIKAQDNNSKHYYLSSHNDQMGLNFMCLLSGMTMNTMKLGLDTKNTSKTIFDTLTQRGTNKLKPEILAKIDKVCGILNDWFGNILHVSSSHDQNTNDPNGGYYRCGSVLPMLAYMFALWDVKDNKELTTLHKQIIKNFLFSFLINFWTGHGKDVKVLRYRTHIYHFDKNNIGVLPSYLVRPLLKYDQKQMQPIYTGENPIRQIRRALNNNKNIQKLIIVYFNIFMPKYAQQTQNRNWEHLVPLGYFASTNPIVAHLDAIGNLTRINADLNQEKQTETLYESYKRQDATSLLGKDNRKHHLKFLDDIDYQVDKQGIKHQHKQLMKHLNANKPISLEDQKAINKIIDKRTNMIIDKLVNYFYD